MVASGLWKFVWTCVNIFMYWLTFVYFDVSIWYSSLSTSTKEERKTRINPSKIPVTLDMCFLFSCHVVLKQTWGTPILLSGISFLLFTCRCSLCPKQVYFPPHPSAPPFPSLPSCLFLSSIASVSWQSSLKVQTSSFKLNKH